MGRVDYTLEIMKELQVTDWRLEYEGTTEVLSTTVSELALFLVSMPGHQFRSWKTAQHGGQLVRRPTGGIIITKTLGKA
jgi:hypothetical protein